MRKWQQTWRPAAYHGDGKSQGFFEGWYFKLVDASERHVFAIIPGIFMGETADGPDESSHCFVQVLDGLTGRSTYHRYRLSDFQAARDRLDVRVGPNHFRSGEITLDIRVPERHLQGELTFGSLSPWPVSLTSPGIMGPYAFAPFMECYHGVVSLDHSIDGQLAVDGVQIDFHGGRGYIEKDWGQSFPKAWIWMQTNHFNRRGMLDPAGTCLTASVATIPWLGSAFRGFIAGLWHGSRLYRFATYTGASIEHLQLSDRQVVWHMTGHALGRRHPVYRLEISATRSEGGLLHAPYRTAMLQRVSESLTAEVSVRLLETTRDGEIPVFEGTGRHAGLEISGATEDILDREQTFAESRGESQ